MATLHNDLILQARHLSASQAEQNIRLGAYTRNGTTYWTGNATLSQSLQGLVTKFDVKQGTSGSQLRAVIGNPATASVGSYTTLGGTFAQGGANLGAEILLMDTAMSTHSSSHAAKIVTLRSDAVTLSGNIKTERDLVRAEIVTLSGAARTQRNLDIANLIDGAEGVLDTLGEISDALNDDASISGSLVTAMTVKEQAIRGSGYSSGSLRTLQDSRDDVRSRIHSSFRARLSENGGPGGGDIYYLDFGTGNNVPYISLERDGAFVNFVVSHNGS